MANGYQNDQVAIVGVGSTAYARDLGRSQLSLGLEAAIKAIEDAGIDKTQIDGISGTGSHVGVGDAGFLSLQGALGIPEATWMTNSMLGSFFVHAVAAVQSGMCDYALTVQAFTRGVGMSRSANNDPFRVHAVAGEGGGGGDRRENPDLGQRWIHTAESYAALMGRYMYEYGAPKEVFGMLAVNNRTHASKNPSALYRTPITMEDYLTSRPVWDPFVLLDMDVPVDCAEAMVITTAERARDLPHKPVYVNAANLGGATCGEYYEQELGWTRTGAWVAMKGLWKRTDLRAADMDLFFPYDGFTTHALNFVEAAGFCEAGGAWDLFQSSWDEDAQILRLNGRTYMSTNGGSLSHGRSGGANYFAEGVRQLRGSEGERQIAGAKTALFGVGSLHRDPAAAVLRVD